MPGRVRSLRLAHGWSLDATPEMSGAAVRDYIRPALQAVPPSIAERLGECRFAFAGVLDDPDAASRWTESPAALVVTVSAADTDPHDVALEALVCIGQALWGRLRAEELTGWLRLLATEIGSGVPGEIDEQALNEKRLLLAGRAAARSRMRVSNYAQVSFAATAAEYVHALWHDVTLRRGPEHLPPAAVRNRLKVLERWFPPGPGYRLFPARSPIPIRSRPAAAKP